MIQLTFVKENIDNIEQYTVCIILGEQQRGGVPWEDERASQQSHCRPRGYPDKALYIVQQARVVAHRTEN